LQGGQKDGNKAQELRGGTHKATAQRTNSQSQPKDVKGATVSPASQLKNICFVAKVKWDKEWQGQRGKAQGNPTGATGEADKNPTQAQKRRIKIQNRVWRLKNKRERP